MSSVPASAIEDADLQAVLMVVGLYHGDLDGCSGEIRGRAGGIPGAKVASVSGNWQSWPLSRRKIALGQLLCHDLNIDAGRVDGLFGPQTQSAFEAFNRKKIGLPADRWRDEIDALPASGTGTTSTTWPTEANVPTFFGSLGTDCGSVPLKRLALPYKMKLAWDLGTEIEGFRVHEKVHDSAARVFDKFYAHYGDYGVEDLGLNLSAAAPPAGRRKRHLVVDARLVDRDRLRSRPQPAELEPYAGAAREARCVKFWEFWEAEGWVSLGRAKDFDWMHVQAARL